MSVSRFVSALCRQLHRLSDFSQCLSQTGRRRRFLSSHPGHVSAVAELEPRCLLAANLRIVDAWIINSRLERVEKPVFGESVGVHVEWEKSGLPASAVYSIRYLVNGIPLESEHHPGNTGNADGRSFWDRWSWFAQRGTNTVSVRLDSGGAISETSESDNGISFTFRSIAPNDLPQKFRWPVEGVRGRDWSITNYPDQDPRPGRIMDYRGGNVTYDGHDAFDIGIGNFAAMDRGVNLLAAADGIILGVVDHHADRNQIRLGAENPPPPNYVLIDHGNGWRTEYVHLARNSAQVRPGDRVRAGQVIGRIGSSGYSDGPHLHITFWRNGWVLDPSVAAAIYFTTPQSYEYSTPSRALDAGLTNDWVQSATGAWIDMPERPSEMRVFSSGGNKDVHFWTILSSVRTNQRFTVLWIRPDGRVARRDLTNADTSGRMAWYLWILPADFLRGQSGGWRVELKEGQRLIAGRSFRVQDASAPPEIRVRQGGELILNGRTTPVEFGRPIAGSAAVVRRFVIQNHGERTLTLRDPELPAGFVLAGEFPARIEPGRSATVTLALTTGSPGLKSGRFRFFTNDADEREYSFLIEGTVRSVS